MAPRRLLFRLVRWLNKRISTSVTFDQLWIGSWDTDDGSIQKICDALTLIRAHDSRRYRRLLNDIRGVWCLLLPGPLGQWVALDRLCELDRRFVRSAAPADIASVIVHEATHARLERLGIGYTPDLRARVEAICMRQQKDFASRLAEPGPMDEQLDAYLALPASHWSDESRARRHRRGSVAALRALNVPDWVIHLVLQMSRAKMKRRRNAAGDSGRPIVGRARPHPPTSG